MSQEFNRRGYEVFLIHPPGPFGQFYRELEGEGINVVELPIRTNFFSALKNIISIVKTNNIRFIHSHQMKADLISVLVKLFVKNVVVVSSVHCVIKHDIKNPIKKIIYSIPSLFSYVLADYVFTVSNAVRDIIISYYHLPAKKVVTTLNGITFDKVITSEDNQKKIRLEFSLNSDVKLISCAGELSTRKGQKYLIECLPYLKNRDNVKVVLLGEGYLKDELEKLAKSKKLESMIIFAGYRTDVYDWMKLSTIYIQPSEFDPLPRALLEAMYLGVPSISSNMDTVKDIIDDGKNGLLTSLEPKLMAKKIDFLISDKDKREKIGQKGKEFIEQNCSISNMADIIESYLC